MLKYLQKTHQQISGYKKGIDNNAALWAAMPITPAIINLHQQQIAQLGQQIEAVEAQLKQKMAEARQLEKQMIVVGKQVEKLAKGIHVQEPEKLIEYDIKPRKTKQLKPLPEKAIIQFIKNDADGEGFRIKLQFIEHAEYYEWERVAMPPGESGTVSQPPYPFLKTSKRLVIIDNDVQPNIRYGYRARGVNRAGAGAWSEPVSAVQ